MANFITSLRIVLSIGLLFCPPLSLVFYILYILAGLTDMIDGAIARKTDTASEFGSKLDTAADFVFVAVCMIKLIPILSIPAWIYVWTALIVLIKVINVVSGYFIYKRFVAVHTVMNKVAGGVLFALPILLPFIKLEYGSVIACSVATFAAIQGGHYIRTKL